MFAQAEGASAWAACFEGRDSSPRAPRTKKRSLGRISGGSRVSLAHTAAVLCRSVFQQLHAITEILRTTGVGRRLMRI